MKKGEKLMRSIARYAAICSVGVIMASTPAFAAAPGVLHTAEEMEHLSDNNLEWYEIDGLISEYNATVVKNRNDYNKDEERTYNASQVTEYLLDEANKMDDLAEKYSDISAILSATYRNSANSLKLQAESNVLDGQIIKMQYDLVEKQTAAGARTAFINYYTSLYEKEYAVENIAYLERVYASTVNRRNLGMATEIEELTAKENLENAKAGLLTTETSIGSNKTGLLVMCGWAYDAEGVIGELPEMSVDSISAINYEADKAYAEANNLTLKMDQIKMSNAKGGSYTELVVTQNENQYGSDRSSFGINFKSAYDSLVNSGTAYTNALNDKAVADQNLAAAQNSYNLGTISELELRAKVIADKSADMAVKKAYAAMVQAKAKYDDALNGNI
ncbi:MAG: TolC family protein [Eubacteriales bacterium]|nr:TolC family protein [Eubacteriales bacterium]